MRLIEYKKQRAEELESMGERNIGTMRINHAYEGEMRLINKIESGVSILFLKKTDIQSFNDGKNDITAYFVRMKENYSRDYSLAHCIGSYANGLLIDEIKSILKHYPDEEYVIMLVHKFGQFLEYTDFEKNIDYTVEDKEENGVFTRDISFSNQEMKEDFELLLKNTISIVDVQKEIDSLKISEDVLFVHHEKGVGYASRNLETLTNTAGYIYQNYLIVD